MTEKNDPKQKAKTERMTPFRQSQKEEEVLPMPNWYKHPLWFQRKSSTPLTSSGLDRDDR